MSAAAIVSAEDYLHRMGKPYCEYLDGVLHALIQKMLMTFLEKQGVEALSEVTVRLSENKFLIPAGAYPSAGSWIPKNRPPGNIIPEASPSTWTAAALSRRANSVSI